MLLDSCDLAFDLNRVVPDAEIKLVLIFDVTLRNFLELFTIKRVNHVDLKNDLHVWLISSQFDLFDDASAHVVF